MIFNLVTMKNIKETQWHIQFNYFENYQETKM